MHTLCTNDMHKPPQVSETNVGTSWTNKNPRQTGEGIVTPKIGVFILRLLPLQRGRGLRRLLRRRRGQQIR